ncbi:MAG: DNA-processing protein DprA [Desulfuromonadaceae bacterium]
MDADQLALLRLNLTHGLGRATLLKLLHTYPCPTAVLEHTPAQWARSAGISAARIEEVPAADDALVARATEYIRKHQVRILTMDCAEYPGQLRQISDPPALLYVRGELSTRPCVAIVGSRRATRDGKRMAKELACDLVNAGFCVVSGMASGIDGAAHEGAISAAGGDQPGAMSTMGVLGGGIDVVYPRSNAHLYQAVGVCGALISEYPPGCEPLAHHFPGRNRIISALSAGVVVVEAAARSGSLITAEFALEQGRDVFAVPGSVYSQASSGTLQLLKDGAIMVTGAQDVVDEYRRLAPASAAKQTLFSVSGVPEQGVQAASPESTSGKDSSAQAMENLSPEEKKVFILLGSDPLHVDEIAGESGLTPMDVSSIVLHLELQGLVNALPGARYIRA